MQIRFVKRFELKRLLILTYSLLCRSEYMVVGLTASFINISVVFFVVVIVAALSSVYQYGTCSIVGAPPLLAAAYS